MIFVLTVGLLLNCQLLTGCKRTNGVLMYNISSVIYEYGVVKQVGLTSIADNTRVRIASARMIWVVLPIQGYKIAKTGLGQDANAGDRGLVSMYPAGASV